jgi:hypothetical protein
METDDLIKATMDRIAASTRPGSVDGVITSVRRRRRIRTTTVVSIATTAVVAAAATVGGLLARSDDNGHPANNGAGLLSFSEWEGGKPETGAVVRDKAQRVFESFAGTVAQRDALGVVRAYEGNKAMDECMADAGHPEWDWSSSRTYADPDDPLKTNTWLAMPFARWRSHGLLADKPFLQAETQLNADESQAYADAVSACLESVKEQPPSGRRVEIDPVVERLTRRWWSFVDGFEASRLPDPSAYVDCMNDADIAMMGGERPAFTEFGTEVGYAMSGASPDDAAIPSDPRSAEEWTNPDWQRFLGLEDEFDRADWQCRRDVYAAHIDDLGPAIDSFASTHADQIEQAVQFWQGIAEQAANLGYTGQVGSLEGQVGHD